MAVRKTTSAAKRSAPPKKAAPKNAVAPKDSAARSAAKASAAKASATKTSATKTAAKATPAKKRVTQAVAARPATKKAANAKAPKSAPARRTAKKTSTTTGSARATAKKAVTTTGPARATSKKTAVATGPQAGSVRASRLSAAAAAAEPQRLRVRENERPWTARELAGVRADLEADIVRLQREISVAEVDLAGLMRDVGDGAGDDPADAGTATFEREQEISLANNAREVFEQSARALARLVAGTYGICESCGNPIGKNRLQAFPRATLCLTCKSQQERR